MLSHYIRETFSRYFHRHLFSGGLQAVGHLTYSPANSHEHTSIPMWQSPDETRLPHSDSFRAGIFSMPCPAPASLLCLGRGSPVRFLAVRFTAVGRERVVARRGDSSFYCMRLSKRSGRFAIFPKCSIHWHTLAAARPVASAICSLRFLYSTRPRDGGRWTRRISGVYYRALPAASAHNSLWTSLIVGQSIRGLAY